MSEPSATEIICERCGFPISGNGGWCNCLPPIITSITRGGQR